MKITTKKLLSLTLCGVMSFGIASTALAAPVYASASSYTQSERDTQRDQELQDEQKRHEQREQDGGDDA